MKTIKFLCAVLLATFVATSLTSCSDDDKGGSLTDTVVGIWEQDGDNDIVQINSGGTGAWYGSLNNFLEGKQSNYTLGWNYSNEIFTLNLRYNYPAGYEYDEDEDSQFWKMRAQSVSKNQIVWKVYETEEGKITEGKYEWENRDVEHDSYGYYYTWTWNRVK